MKVRYKIRNIKRVLEKELSNNESRYFSRYNILPSELNLTYDREYVVLGIDFISADSINFMIADDTGFSYPNFYPQEFFDISDYRLSTYWFGDIGKYYPIEGINYPCLITFKEALRDYFFDDLINCRGDAQNIFLKYLRLLEDEYPENDLKTAVYIADGWAFCAYCNETWNVESEKGVVICPYCHKRNNNPLWKGLTPL